MLIFIHKSVVPIFRLIVQYLNRNGRVSDEVLSLHLVEPRIEAVGQLVESLKKHPSLKYVENIRNLRPNNGLKDLLSGTRLTNDQMHNYMLLVSIETVTDAYRKKYPNPNVTLQAGSVEKQESIMSAGIRELREEANILVQSSIVNNNPMKLLGGGLFMYVCCVHKDTQIQILDNSIKLSETRSTWPRGFKI